MRSYVPGYDLIQGTGIEHVLEMLGEYRPFAGGTDIMVLFEAGKLAHQKWINIRGLLALRGTGIYRRWFVVSIASFLACICGILAYETPFNVINDFVVNGVVYVPPTGEGMVPINRKVTAFEANRTESFDAPNRLCLFPPARSLLSQ